MPLMIHKYFRFSEENIDQIKVAAETHQLSSGVLGSALVLWGLAELKKNNKLLQNYLRIVQEEGPKVGRRTDGFPEVP